SLSLLSSPLLYESPYRQRNHGNKHHPQGPQLPTLYAYARPFARELLFCSGPFLRFQIQAPLSLLALLPFYVSRAPVQDCGSQYVMEDLKSTSRRPIRRRFNRAQNADASRRQLLEHRHHIGLGTLGQGGQVGGYMRDLGAGRRYQIVKDV